MLCLNLKAKTDQKFSLLMKNYKDEAFNFLNDTNEDIYSITDGKPNNNLIQYRITL